MITDDELRRQAEKLQEYLNVREGSPVAIDETIKALGIGKHAAHDRHWLWKAKGWMKYVSRGTYGAWYWMGIGKDE